MPINLGKAATSSLPEISSDGAGSFGIPTHQWVSPGLLAAQQTPPCFSPPGRWFGNVRARKLNSQVGCTFISCCLSDLKGFYPPAVSRGGRQRLHGLLWAEQAGTCRMLCILKPRLWPCSFCCQHSSSPPRTPCTPKLFPNRSFCQN